MADPIKKFATIAIAAVAALGIVTAKAEPAQDQSKVKGRCLVEYQGKTILDGDCVFSVGFIIAGKQPMMFTTPDYKPVAFVTYYFDGDRVIASLADGPAIGDVERDSDCWSNATGKVCFWKAGAR